MINYTFDNLKRVSKKSARKLFDKGNTLLLVPCKIRPDNMFGIGVYVNANADTFGDDFDKVVHYFEYYNCNSETGLYTSYYVKEI